MSKTLLTCQEVADITQIHISTIYSQRKNGTLASVKKINSKGRKTWMINKADIQKINTRDNKEANNAIVFISEESGFNNSIVKKTTRYCKQQKLRYRIYTDSVTTTDKRIYTETPTIKKIVNKLKEDTTIKKLILSGAEKCFKRAYLTSVAQNLNIEIIHLEQQKKVTHQ